MSKIELVSKDNKHIFVLKKATIMSTLISDMVEECDDTDIVIPILNVDGTTLKLVVNYMEYHYQNRAIAIEKPLKNNNLNDVICAWDIKFLKRDHSVIIDLITAANYMNIEDLLQLCCAKIACDIKGNSPEKIREMFGIENEFCPQDEEKIAVSVVLQLSYNIFFNFYREKING